MTDPRNYSSTSRPHYRATLEQCRDLLSGFMDGRFPELFAQAGAALLEFSGRAESNAVQGRFSEAMGLLQRRRSDIEHVFRQQLNAGFRNFGSTEAGTQDFGPGPGGAAGELSLVDPDDMEECVAAEGLVSRANANYFPDLYALRQRLSVIAGGRKLRDYEIPASPHHLMHCFRRALDGLDVEVKVKVVLYALFDEFVIRQCRSVYNDYNEILKAAGILPNLKPMHVPKAAAQPKAAERSRQGEQAPLAQDKDPSAAASLTPGEQADQGTELFDTILDLMAVRRPTRQPGGGRPGQPGADRDRRAPTPERAAAATGHLLSALNEAQARTAAKSKARSDLAATDGGAPAPAAQPGTTPEPAAPGNRAGYGDYPNIEVDAAFLDRVRMALAQERQQVLEQINRADLSPVDADLIDLIGMLFEYMLNDPILPNAAKALLSHLHTPYLKVALIDRRLLVDSRHPARRLLDEMVEAGSVLVEEGSPTRGIFPVMQQTVDRILQEFTDDIGLFDELLETFKRAMQEQQRRTDTTEQRTQDAARGREKLQVSKQRAARQMHALAARHPIPKALSNFLSTTWQDLLVFVLLREKEGEKSIVWRDAVATAEELVALFDPNAASTDRRARIERIPQLRNGILHEVDRMGSYSRTTVDALSGLLDNPKAWKAEETQSPAEALTRTGKAGALLTGIPAGLPQADTGQDVPLSGPQKEMIERLRKMRFGTWFEFTPQHGNAPRRLKLSWMSQLTSTCMFVDRSGTQAEVKTLGELADEILSGRAKVIPRPKHPFIDRALMSIRKVLQAEGGEGSEPVGG
jgi:hypothetical protein